MILKILSQTTNAVPKYIDALQENKSLSIFMELCDSDLGKLIAERRDKCQTFTEVEILQIFEAISEALTKLHELDYAHMDIKPRISPFILENILIKQSQPPEHQEARLAHQEEPGSRRSTSPPSSMQPDPSRIIRSFLLADFSISTRISLPPYSVVEGDFAYLPAEMLAEDALGGVNMSKVDIFSLGILIYELMRSKRIFMKIFRFRKQSRNGMTSGLHVLIS